MSQIINNIKINNTNNQNHETNGNKKWWENTWFQIIMLLAGLSTIFSLIFIFYKPEISKEENSSIKNNESLQNNNFLITASKINSVSTSTNAQLDNIRKEHGLRQLLPLESDLSITELPLKTYFYISSVYLRVSPHENFSEILNARVNRFWSYNDLYFEVHKISQEDIYLIGFISEESYIKLNKKNTTPINLTMFPRQVYNADYLIILPIQVIAESNVRDITFDDGSEVSVIDIKVQK